MKHSDGEDRGGCVYPGVKIKEGGVGGGPHTHTHIHTDSSRTQIVMMGCPGVRVVGVVRVVVDGDGVGGVGVGVGGEGGGGVNEVGDMWVSKIVDGLYGGVHGDTCPCGIVLPLSLSLSACSHC